MVMAVPLMSTDSVSSIAPPEETDETRTVLFVNSSFTYVPPIPPRFASAMMDARSIAATAANKGILTPMQLVEKMSYNPAKVLGIAKGNLKEGSIADIVIADFAKEWQIDVADFASKGKNTPFQGRKVNGYVNYTLVNGQVVYEA